MFNEMKKLFNFAIVDLKIIMTTAQGIRFAFILALWLLVCWALIASTPRITLHTIFAIVASAIIVFVPIYKKYKRNGKADN